MDIKIEKLDHKDIEKFTELVFLFEDVFEMKDFKIPARAHLQQLLDKDDFFVFVALLDNKVVGGLTSYIMQQYYSTSPLVYIFDLAVKREVQWKGIGKMLIVGNNEYCKSIGAEAVMVEADEVDDYAVKFYRSTGAVGQKVIHFDYLMNDK
ncbi:MAG: GCN5-related N-acetyltransferase [Bacteroidetes bacterium]|nr:GCN5-related N-acetyltransferase [Bacteroidota bacterium]